MAMVRTNQTTALPTEVRAATVPRGKTEVPEVTPVQVGQAARGATAATVHLAPEGRAAPAGWVAPIPLPAMEPRGAMAEILDPPCSVQGRGSLVAAAAPEVPLLEGEPQVGEAAAGPEEVQQISEVQGVEVAQAATPILIALRLEVPEEEVAQAAPATTWGAPGAKAARVETPMRVEVLAGQEDTAAWGEMTSKAEVTAARAAAEAPSVVPAACLARAAPRALLPEQMVLTGPDASQGCGRLRKQPDTFCHGCPSGNGSEG